MADITNSTAPERDDTPETKWQAAWANFLPTWEQWGALDEMADNTSFTARARAEREAFMLVPAPTISALATKMMVADACDDDHHDLCLADLRMMEWRELVAAYDAAKAEACRLSIIQDEVDTRHFEAREFAPNAAETEAVKQEALAAEKVYEAAVDAQQAAWEKILDFPPPTAAAFGIKTRLVCRERGFAEEKPALDSLLADVTRLIGCGQFPGWDEYCNAAQDRGEVKANGGNRTVLIPNSDDIGLTAMND